MKRIFKAALFATTVLAPAAALAASPGAQSTAPGAAAANPCDQLLQAFDRPADAGRLTITRQQAQTFKNNNDLNSCRTALNTLQTPAAQGSAATASASGTTPSSAAGAAAGTSAAGTAGAAPQVTIQQPAPQVIIQQTQPTVSVAQGQPEIIVHQPAPIVTVQIPPPEITVRMPKPEVNVAQAQPQVQVQQERPTVQVVPAPNQQVATVVETPRPVVRFSSDQPQVTVNRAEQPNIRFEELAPGQQQAALSQSQTATTGQTSAAGNQLMVSDLQGKILMGPQPNDRFGTITAVIMDTQNKPFVIVEKDGRHYAVDVNNVQMRGQNLMIVGVTDTSRFPAWNDADPANRNVKRLTPQERVTISPAG
jgi:hypothetical protein